MTDTKQSELEKWEKFLKFWEENREELIEDSELRNEIQPELWKQKHDFAYTFAHMNAQKFQEIWNQILSEKKDDLDPWIQLVESQELWDFAKENFDRFSDFSQSLIGGSEYPNDGQNLITTSGRQYFLVPLGPSMIRGFEKMPDEGDDEALNELLEGSRSMHGCREFLKTVYVYVFSIIFPKEDFTVYYMTHKNLEFSQGKRVTEL